MRRDGYFSEIIALVMLIITGWFVPLNAVGDDSICARVKIEIRQELTLERQGFDAHMRITNGLTHVSLENVDIDVSFADEEGNPVLASSDPNNTDALFFIRIDSMSGIDDVDGAGIVSPNSVADIHWLIIPAQGASNGLEQGTLYYVGAKLTYTIGGEEHVTEVSPDYIFVKPMPDLVLDYFLPNDVYGDDPFTSEIEPEIPFSLGVRVSNTGQGVGRSLKIESAQPKIVENEQGLLINFHIQGSEVNGADEIPSLLVDFGDIDPNAAGTARWIMTCSLYGKFVEFTAEFTHADELGGELTSLISAVNTHFLVHDVLVDLPSRDAIRDFLALDGNGYMVYESDNVDSAVTDQSASAGMVQSGTSGTQTLYTLTVPATDGLMVVKLDDPLSGNKVIKSAYRSDGKQISLDNVWLFKTREKNNPWQYYFYLFDVNTPGTYTIVFEDPAVLPQAPVLQFIPDRSKGEGRQLSFIVEASDPNGTIPMLSASPLPAGAGFIDQKNGTGIFDWTPAVGQAGRYVITFTASDGVLKDSQRVAVNIYSSEDNDGDGMLDAWELEHFGTLDRDGTGDYDGDGISDLDEYLNGTDPASSNAPSIPEIFSPEGQAEVTTLQPDLVIQNSSDPDGDVITYTFEIYSDEGMSSLVASELNVSEAEVTTSWTVPETLQDNHWYHWRARATDGVSFSQWAYGSFFVNTVNDAPGEFFISNPQDDSEVDTQTPVLEVTNSVDVDGDTLTYSYEVYSDESMITLVASVSGIPEGGSGSTSWVVDTELQDNTWYFWRSIAIDEHGASTACGLGSFFVNTFNDAPVAPTIISPADGSEIAVQELDLIINNSTDVDGDTLTYFFELDKVNTFDSPSKQTAGPVQEGEGNTAWHVSDLDDNTCYFWRVRANDGAADSEWIQGSFFVNLTNDAPSIPTLKNPGQEAWVAALVPTLEINPSVDLDNDTLIYRFELYADAGLTQLVATVDSDLPQWVVPQALTDNTWYYWRAQAEDEHGATSGWMETASFFTDSNGINDPPTIVIQEPSEDLITNTESILISWADSDPDSNARIALYYDTDAGGEDGILIVSDLDEDFDDQDDQYMWDTSTLADGTYYLYATITDEISSISVYAPGAIHIDRTAPLVTATPNGGNYDDTQYVTLAANETATIYYTLDGSEPTTASALYTAPIEVNTSLTLSAIALDPADNLSSVITETYVINSPPVADDLAIATDEDTEVAVICSGSDVDNDELTFTLVSGPANGTLNGTLPEVSYVPATDYNGPDSFTFIVNDGEFDSNVATVSITVNPVNDAPVAYGQAVDTDEDVSLPITCTGSDIDSNELTYSLVAGPSHGTLSGTLPAVTYTPDPNYNGFDSFTFKINDGGLDSNVAAANITINPVNDAPIAYGQAVQTDEDVPLPITCTGSDIDSNELTYSLVAGPSHGTLSGTLPAVTYTPDPDYNGFDSFTFKINDGGLDSNVATANITIDPVNDPPLISITNSSQGVQYSDSIQPVTVEASDIDSSTLSISAVNLPEGLVIGPKNCLSSEPILSCVWSIEGYAMVASGSYEAQVVVSDEELESQAILTIEVESEKAGIVFDDYNPVAVQVSEPGGTSGSFTLAVNIKEVEDPVDHLGDINLAETSMTLIPVGPGNPSDPVSINSSFWDVDDRGELYVISTFENVPVNTYTLEVSIEGGYYSAYKEDVLTVFDPSLGFTTGGGWFYWPGTEDPQSGYSGDKTNLGFNMSYNKKGDNVKGSLLLISHLPDGSIYRVKSNALYGLAIGEEIENDENFGWASFSGKCTYLQPGWIEPEGNHEFIIYVEDRNEPGTGLDQVWFETFDKDHVIIESLSMPEPAIDNTIDLEGGNIVVPHKER